MEKERKKPLMSVCANSAGIHSNGNVQSSPTLHLSPAPLVVAFRRWGKDQPPPPGGSSWSVNERQIFQFNCIWGLIQFKILMNFVPFYACSGTPPTAPAALPLRCRSKSNGTSSNVPVLLQFVYAVSIKLFPGWYSVQCYSRPWTKTMRPTSRMHQSTKKLK